MNLEDGFRAWFAHRRVNLLIGILFFALPLIFLSPGLSDFPYPSEQAKYSDFAITHYPNALYLQRSLIECRCIPLWSPTILSGYPFAANPLSGLWYPPGWLALLFPLPLGLNLMTALHLSLGGWGMYRLLRVEGLRIEAAVLGGLGFILLPKTFAHYGAGHLTLVYAFSWTGWLLEGARLQVNRHAVRCVQKNQNSFFYFPMTFQPAIAMSLIFLADPRWSFFAGILWLCYTWGHCCATLMSHNNVRRFLSLNIQLLLMALVIAGLIAPLALPMWEYTRLSSRISLSPQDVWTYTLPLARLLGLIFPDFGGFQEYMIYAGGGILILSLLATTFPAIRRRAGIWMAVVPMALWFSIGFDSTIGGWMAGLPGISLLRVPSRALFLNGMALLILATHAIDSMMGEIPGIVARRGGMIVTALAGLTLMLGLSVWVMVGHTALTFAWGMGAILVGSIWIGLRLANKIPAGAWWVGMLLLCLLDWGALDRTLFAPRPAQVVLAEGDQLAKYLASQPGHFRVYSPSYSLPQQTAAYYHVELADGVDPLQLQSYVSFMQSASGVPSNGYSVTLPPFAEPAEARPSTSSGGVPTAEPAEARPSTSSGDAPTAEPVEAGSVEAPPSTSSGGVPTAEPAEARPSTSSGSDPARANAAYRPDPRLLGLLNVRYVAAEFDLPVEGLVLRSRWGETRLYENLAARPRAWIRLESGKPVGLPVGLDEEDNYEDWRWLPNSIEGYVEGPGLLILSEMMYPGWRATIDGRPVQIETDHGLLRTVLLQAGRQYFRMYYQPDSVLSGLAICVDTLILLAILFGIKRRGRRQGRSGGAKGLVSQA